MTKHDKWFGMMTYHGNMLFVMLLLFIFMRSYSLTRCWRCTLDWPRASRVWPAHCDQACRTPSCRHVTPTPSARRCSWLASCWRQWSVSLNVMYKFIFVVEMNEDVMWKTNNNILIDLMWILCIIVPYVGKLGIIHLTLGRQLGCHLPRSCLRTRRYSPSWTCSTWRKQCRRWWFAHSATSTSQHQEPLQQGAIIIIRN